MIIILVVAVVVFVVVGFARPHGGIHDAPPVQGVFLGSPRRELFGENGNLGGQENIAVFVVGEKIKGRRFVAAETPAQIHPAGGGQVAPQEHLEMGVVVEFGAHFFQSGHHHSPFGRHFLGLVGNDQVLDQSGIGRGRLSGTRDSRKCF